MNTLLLLVAISIGLGIVGLLACLWSVRKDQYDDLDGAASRILDSDDVPIEKPTKI